MSSCNDPGSTPENRSNQHATHSESFGANLKHIFHHPVGVFPAAARWYLAGIAVTALLCVAMQLSIQAYAQQQAKDLVQAWAERAMVHIGDVRYHLLRNGLILRDIQIERGDDRIAISQMLLRANPKLLTGNAPRIGVIDISGLNAEITNAGQSEIWQHDSYLRQIWQAATSLSVHDGNLKFYVHDKNSPPLSLSKLSLRQQRHSSIRRITGSARMQQGKLNWQWNMLVASEPVTQPQTERWLSKGSLHWQGLDVEKLTASLALKQVIGHLSGALTWQTDSRDSEQAPSFNMHGDMQFDTGVDTKPSHVHRLQYSATEADGRWQMDIDAAVWPLDPWSDVLPKIGRRQLISAQMDGKMHWQGQAGNWDINSDQGLLQDITYARTGINSSASQPWYWSRIRYQHASLQTAKHRLQLTEVEMLDSRLVLQTKRMDTATANQIAGAQAQASPRGDASDALSDAAKDVTWEINADNIVVQNMMLALAMPQGQVTLEKLDGKIRNPKGKPLRFKLHTHAEKTADQGAAPAGAESGENLPHWLLRGKVEKNRQGQLASANIRLQGTHIPVARLRPLLPLQDDADRPVKLAGEADFKAMISVDQGVWQMQGKATVRDLNLSHGGNVWLAEQVKVHFGPVGMGLDMQTIDRIESPAWQYIAALQPLPLHVADNLSDAIQAPDGVPWWMTTLRSSQISIHHLALEHGQISLGQQQAVWAEQINIDIDHIETDQWADIAITGKMGGSDFHLKGQWQALSDSQGFRGDAELQQAEPFFLHNWMVASGMPRLIRGRLSAGLHLETGQDPGIYQGSVTFKLLQGLTETGIFTSDPMLSRTGFSTPELLQRLEQSPGLIALQYHLNGLWLTQPLTLKSLGLSLQVAMHEAARKGQWRAEKTAQKMTVEAQIRLHGRERLSLNERNRLSKVVHKLIQKPQMIIEIQPKWSGTELTAEMQQRIRRTQQLIEQYMSHRNIDKSRIFAIWPTSVDQVDEIGSVQIASKIMQKR